VASNAASREYLLTWDPASTDRIKEDKRKAAKNAEKEETLGLMLVKQGKSKTMPSTIPNTIKVGWLPFTNGWFIIVLLYPH